MFSTMGYMATVDPAASSYWYGSGDDEHTAAALLAALREYRAAEADLQRRTRAQMRLSDNELLAVGIVSRSAQAGDLLQPGELARQLGLSTSSVTGLIDRLEKAGYVERRPHPSDRRKLALAPTSHADARTTLSGVHEGIIRAVQELAPDEIAGAMKFLEHMTRSVRDILVATQAIPTMPSEAPRTEAHRAEPVHAS
jgi:DNA-binding MarR family transcriptional regulator